MQYVDQLDPELRKFAKTVPYNKRIIKAGNLYQTAALRLTKVPQDVTMQKLVTEGYRRLRLKTEIFSPAKRRGPLPALLYVHGGAFTYKAAVYHKQLACIYAEKACCSVFFPDYHLAPEYPYPAAFEDVLSLYRYLTAHTKDLGIQKKKIGLAGDSAGAFLAALLSSQYETRNLQRPCLQLLVYPLTAVDIDTASRRDYTDTPMWNSRYNDLMWEYYFGDTPDDLISRESPMNSSLPADFPDTYIETAEFDCLHDEGILYGKKLTEAGVNVELNETVGTFHGYDSAIDTQIATRNIERRISFLQKQFMRDENHEL